MKSIKAGDFLDAYSCKKDTVDHGNGMYSTVCVTGSAGVCFKGGGSEHGSCGAMDVDFSSGQLNCTCD